MDKFARGTVTDVEKMKNQIVRCLGEKHVYWPKMWKADQLYSTPQPDLKKVKPPSDALEKAWGEVGAWYVRYQNVDDAEVVEEADNTDVNDAEYDIDDEVY